MQFYAKVFLVSSENIEERLSCLFLNLLRNQQTANKEKQSDCFFVKNGTITQKINFDDILFVEGMKDYLRIHKSYVIAINKMDSIE